MLRQFRALVNLIASHFSKKPVFKIFPKDIEKEFREIYAKCKDYTMTSMERMYALYCAVEYAVNSNIQGDFVECGIWKGGSSMLMALTLLKAKKTDCKIFLYDTFKGMPKPTKKEEYVENSFNAQEHWKKTKRKGYSEWCYAGIDEVKKNMLSTACPKKTF